MTALHQHLLAWNPDATDEANSIRFGASFRRDFWQYFGSRMEPEDYQVLHKKALLVLNLLDEPDLERRDVLREIAFDSLFRSPRFHPAEHGLPDAERDCARHLLDDLEHDIECYGHTGVSSIQRGALAIAVGEPERGYAHFADARAGIAGEHYSGHHLGVTTAYEPRRIFEASAPKESDLIGEPWLVQQGSNPGPSSFAFFSTMDPVFFLCFARRYVESLSVHNPGAATALAVLDAPNAFLDWAADRLREWTPSGTGIWLFGQKVRARDKPPIFASARFLDAPAVAAHLDRDLLILDADMEAVGPTVDLREWLPAMEIGLNVNDGYPGHIPWRKVNASQFFFARKSLLAAEFVDEVRHYFRAAYSAHNPTNWWIDQNALGAAFAMHSRAEFYPRQPAARRIAQLQYSRLTRIRQQKLGFVQGVATRAVMLRRAREHYQQGEWDRALTEEDAAH